jgi:hypothetical protein
MIGGMAIPMLLLISPVRVHLTTPLTTLQESTTQHVRDLSGEVGIFRLDSVIQLAKQMRRDRRGKGGRSMKISYREYSGYTGLLKSCELDTDTMSIVEAQKVRILVEQSMILTLRESQPQDTDARDMPTAEVRLETDGIVHEILLNQANITEKGKLLLNYLRTCANATSP